MDMEEWNWYGMMVVIDEGDGRTLEGARTLTLEGARTLTPKGACGWMVNPDQMWLEEAEPHPCEEPRINGIDAQFKLEQVELLLSGRCGDHGNGRIYRSSRECRDPSYEPCGRGSGLVVLDQ